jgi:hypothetical protein
MFKHFDEVLLCQVIYRKFGCIPLITAVYDIYYDHLNLLDCDGYCYYCE